MSSDLVTVNIYSIRFRVPWRSHPGFQTWVLDCGGVCVCVCARARLVCLCACVWVVYGTLWNLQGQLLGSQLSNSNRYGQQLDLTFPCSPPDVANLCRCLKLCRMVWMPVARPLGRPLLMPLPSWPHWSKSQGWSLGPLVVL